MLPIADRWFEIRKVSDDITLLWEPHVVPLMRCNIWHVRGRDRDLMIDTGMGIASLRAAAKHLLDKRVTAVATHTHTDHVGGHHEFEHTLVHELEAEELRSPRDRGTLLASVMGSEEIAKLAKAGYPFDGDLITALPRVDYDLATYRLKDAPVTETVTEGDIVDIATYIRTMKRLRELPVEIVHAGHDPSFGRARLVELADAYLAKRDR
jgi:glyoxylase-like metal-dependent hydrolase (beta-lactamase superfamily II)